MNDPYELQQKLFTVFEQRVMHQPACEVHGENIYELATYFGYMGRLSTSVTMESDGLSLRMWNGKDGDENVDITVKTGEILLVDSYHQPSMVMSRTDFLRSWQRPDHEQRIRQLEASVAALTKQIEGSDE